MARESGGAEEHCALPPRKVCLKEAPALSPSLFGKLPAGARVFVGENLTA